MKLIGFLIVSILQLLMGLVFIGLIANETFMKKETKTVKDIIGIILILVIIYLLGDHIYDNYLALKRTGL